MTYTPPTVAEIAAGLRQLADFLEAHPELPTPLYLDTVNTWCPWDADQVAAVIRAAKADGIPIEKQNSDTMRNVAIEFGPVKAMALINKSQVCERVVVGQKVELVPDPEFVPPATPMIEQVVDITEWRCLPLLAPREEAAR